MEDRQSSLIGFNELLLVVYAIIKMEDDGGIFTRVKGSGSRLWLTRVWILYNLWKSPAKFLLDRANFLRCGTTTLVFHAVCIHLSSCKVGLIVSFSACSELVKLPCYLCRIQIYRVGLMYCVQRFSLTCIMMLMMMRILKKTRTCYYYGGSNWCVRSKCLFFFQSIQWQAMYV